jgi:hypothetical protein
VAQPISRVAHGEQKGEHCENAANRDALAAKIASVYLHVRAQVFLLQENSQ